MSVPIQVILEERKGEKAGGKKHILINIIIYINLPTGL